MPAKPFKIAVLRYRYIGDTLLTIPFLRALRYEMPEAEVDLYTGADALALMQPCPYITRAISLEPKQTGFWKTIRLLKQQRYERIYLLKRSFSSACIAFMADIPQRIGFDTEGRGFLLTQKIPYRSHLQHEAQCYLDLLGSTRVPQADDLKLDCWLTPEALQAASSWLNPHDTFRVVLHGTSTNAAKQWPLRHFETLGRLLIQRHVATVYLLGTEADAMYYQPLIQALGTQHVVNLCGKTRIEESAALLQHMDLVVANDSGMVHLAAACEVPLVSLFGPMDPLQWRPLSNKATVLVHPHLSCQPCRMKITCHHQYPCLTEISPQQVYHACLPYLTS